MADQTVVSAAAIWQSLFDKLTATGTELDFTKTGKVYFVEANAGDDSNDGSDWDNAFLTMEYALKVCDAEISNSTYGYGRGWSSRNKIYCKGTFTENLVKLADKTDVIGVGIGATRARITGTHVPADNTYGTRMINFELRDDGSSSMWTFAAGGFEFHNCWFRNFVGITGTHGIKINDPSDVRIENCQFSAWPGTIFTTAAIALTATTDAANVRNCFIENNYIKGAKGITVGEGVFTDCVIRNNLIYATTFCIQDISVGSGAEGFFVVRNDLFSAVDNTTNNAGIVDSNPERASNNLVTGSNHTDRYPTIAA